MDQSQKIILTPFKLFEWKEEMEILLRVKGIDRVNMDTEAEPYRRDEAYGLLCIRISRDLLFHLDGLTSPDQVWEKLADIFWKDI